MHEPEIEARPWAEQQALDEPLYRAQIQYLFARSVFYRNKLGEAGFATPDAVGGLDDIARLPFTEKDELRASRDEAHPIGTHLAAPMEEIVRIFSTSGTTGTPSYIPLTAQDLQNWVRTAARSYAASGITAAGGIVSPHDAGAACGGAGGVPYCPAAGSLYSPHRLTY